MAVHIVLIIVFLYPYISQSLAVKQFINKNNSKSWLFLLFLRVITFHLFHYLEIKVKKDDYWGEYD